MKNLFLFAVLLCLYVSCNTSSGKGKPEDDSLQYYPPTPGKLDKEDFRSYYRQLSSFFDTGLLKSGFNGGILIAKDGNIIYEKYQGKVDLRKNDSITSNTSFHIASTSKTFTAIAILRLIQENQLSLNDTITKFFPGFPYADITVKLLLSHRSGLPNYLYFMSNSNWDKKKYVTNEDVLQFLINEKPNKSYSPDKRFNYCNTNFVLLALIVERITGKSFPEYMQQKIFNPLQMANSFVFTYKDTLSATTSFTYNGTFWNNDFLDITYGDKNIYSTPLDLLKWDQALYTDQLLNSALLDSAFAPHSFEKLSIHNYGLGWRLQLLPNGKKVVYHFGKWHGFNASFARLIDEKATIIILGNKFNRNIYGAASQCYDIFGDYMQTRQPQNYDSENPEAVVKETKKETKSTSPAKPKADVKKRR
ncbi:MAG: beta-lactamase family protein [Chitinophagaceae bacterium]|nr:beta-lactamase family protein [Chitinophagaceae bacterium]